ncbi:MAG: hypothetical protein R3236_10630 [Phycisphaeraceae bacterium]|nr:hypothetical protein [Phycisphaeraceae bacterium]
MEPNRPEPKTTQRSSTWLIVSGVLAAISLYALASTTFSEQVDRYIESLTGEKSQTPEGYEFLDEMEVSQLKAMKVGGALAGAAAAGTLVYTLVLWRRELRMPADSDSTAKSDEPPVAG